MRHKILITGSCGLIGFELTLYYLHQGWDVIGIDNNEREIFFKTRTLYKKKLSLLRNLYGKQYAHYHQDIRNKKFLTNLFKKHTHRLDLIIHTAAQTSHNWSQTDPATDYSINADATFLLLELYKQYCFEAVFIYTSTNKAYGDLVNKLSFIETGSRFDLAKTHLYYQGIDETFSIDQSTHSLFGISKLSADLLVQEYGRYYGLKTGIFRLGVVTGKGQNGTFQQGFLSYFIKQAREGKPLSILGYKGKQVRDLIHVSDVVRAFDMYYQKPNRGEVFNLGGGRENSISLRELHMLLEKIIQKKITMSYHAKERKGDHKWWISNCAKFKKKFPKWSITKSVDQIAMEIFNNSYV